AIRTCKRAHDLLGTIYNLNGNEAIAYYSVLDHLTQYSVLKGYNDRRYVYIFVRQDIKPEYQLVQAAHVALQAGYSLRRDHMYGEPSDNEAPNKLYFTVVGVKDKLALNGVQNHLEDLVIGHSMFIEPDINNEMTAIATLPIPVRKRGELLRYKLLTFA
ncbi:MAG: hypothetical protein ACREQ5_11810, partial [Candidatus Dormibacteria bacterium]